MMFQKTNKPDFRAAASAWPVLPRDFTASSKPPGTPKANPFCLGSNDVYALESGIITGNGNTLSALFVERKERNRAERRKEIEDFYASMWRYNFAPPQNCQN